MANVSEPAPFLPSIRCSDCNQEIEISQMAEHICSGPASHPTPPPEPYSRTSMSSTTTSKRSTTSSSGFLRPTRAQPPRIDAAAANRPFLRSDQLTPISLPSNSRSPSPGIPHGLHPPLRSATTPVTPFPRPLSPPSPELRSQDCAFPPFPTYRSRSATGSRQNSARHPPPEPSPMYAPLSPKPNAGGNVLKRMNTIAPGPFDVKSRRGKHGEEEVKGEEQKDMAPGHNHTRNMSADGNIPALLRSGIGGIDEILHLPPEISNRPNSPRLDRDGMPLPTGPAPPRPTRPDDNMTPPPIEQPTELGLEEPAQDTPGSRPVSPQSSDVSAAPTGPLPRRPSEPATTRGRRPTLAAANRPTINTNVPRVDLPSATGTPTSPASTISTAFPPRRSSRAGETPRPRLDDAPPVPQLDKAKQHIVGNPYHTPTESQSSNGSGSGSDGKSGSSRSSPPMSEASDTYPPKLTRPNNLDMAIRNLATLSPDSSTPGRSPLSPTGGLPSFGRPTELQLPPAGTPRKDSGMGPPESPMDPAVYNGVYQNPPKPSPEIITPTIHQPKPPAPAQPRPSVKNKGKCRGCGQLITGKSISSADGRLTGRYHKQCFVCFHCKEAFQTADFYVLDNHPYCERHYHVLNKSLCQRCDRGIEGQYLETEKRQKYHPYCFTCQDCRIPLRDDYFEMNGRTYCERHAFRRDQQTSFLGPGRKHPERRTTRLMMMT